MSSPPDGLLDVTDAEYAEALRAMPEHRVIAHNGHFPLWAHKGQLPPEAAPDGVAWRTWVVMAGRGFGKTRCGAEWVLSVVRGEEAKALSPSGERVGRGGRRGRCADSPSPSPSPGSAALPQAEREGDSRAHPLRIALVAATVDEARRIMVEGESGLLACAREGEIADWAPARRELRFASGAIATLYSGASPEALRGPQHHIAWADELAKWRHPQATWDMLQFGLRLKQPAAGDTPRALVTTTPKGGCATLARILADPRTAQTGGSTRANPHLPDAFIDAIDAAYGGTRMGREEIDGVLLEDVAGSLWPRALIARSRGPVPPERDLRRVIVGVDPPASEAGTCGIVVCALDADGVGHVLADRTASGLSPEGWAQAVARAAEDYGADRVIAEQNQGGAMVRTVLTGAGLRLPVTLVSATRGKAARAEPVAGQFERGTARLAGRFPELEDELAALVPGGGYAGPGKSPDRADAMVWALWALLKPQAEPRVRAV